jgi:hypothetical protein
LIKPPLRSVTASSPDVAMKNALQLW